MVEQSIPAHTRVVLFRIPSFIFLGEAKFMNKKHAISCATL
jgi:hypothetical protein